MNTKLVVSFNHQRLKGIKFIQCCGNEADVVGKRGKAGQFAFLDS